MFVYDLMTQPHQLTSPYKLVSFVLLLLCRVSQQSVCTRPDALLQCRLKVCCGETRLQLGRDDCSACVMKCRWTDLHVTVKAVLVYYVICHPYSAVAASLQGRYIRAD